MNNEPNQRLIDDDPKLRDDLPATPGNDVDLERVLKAWNSATERLQQTHRVLRSEVKRLTDELEVKNRELARKNRLADLGQMASHIAHEVRNSLMPMTLYSSLLRRRLEGETGRLEIVDQLDSGLMALGATVSDLLQFTSEREPQLTWVCPKEIIQEVCSSLEPQLKAQSIEIDTTAPADIRLAADLEMMRRALLNLLLNAIDVMPQGGRLGILVHEQNNTVELQVTDSGPGISDEHLPRLFEPFFTTKSGGTGLGLAIVERVAFAHGGTFDAKNLTTGGAAFSMCLPLQPSKAVA